MVLTIRRNMQAQDKRHAGPPNDSENSQHGCHHYERRAKNYIPLYVIGPFRPWEVIDRNNE